MKFDTPATTNPIDQLKVIGRPTDRIEGPLKTTGAAPYAYERHDVAAHQAYGYVLGAGIATGRITAMDVSRARRAPGVIAVLTTLDISRLTKSPRHHAYLFGGAEIQHYHQAIAVVVAETFEQARSASQLIAVTYAPAEGRFDLAAAAKGTDVAVRPVSRTGDFETAFAAAPVQLDAAYTTPNQSHAMMEPHATIAAWEGDALTLWTSTQMVAWTRTAAAQALGIPEDKVRIVSPYVGGGFGAKLFIRSDLVLAALAAKAARRPVKIALQRALVANNTVHRPATIQRIRIGAGADGRITAIGHESVSGNLKDGFVEGATGPSRRLYAGANRMLAQRLATLDLPEGNAMRAPGEASGLMAIEIAMDEAAEKLGLDPIAFRILNDTQVDPQQPGRRFSYRDLSGCLRRGAEEFQWNRRNPRPAQVRDGPWLVGMGVAAGIRDNLVGPSAARVAVDGAGVVTVTSDMTDIGTGSYTVMAQTAAEMMGVGLDKVAVLLGDSNFPVAAGSGGQWGGNLSTAGVYAACMKLREAIAAKLGLDPAEAQFADGQVLGGNRWIPLGEAVGPQGMAAEDAIAFGDLAKTVQQSTFVAHFVEVGVDVATGETRVRRMLAVCSAGRILNPKAARSQVIGAMTMGVGAALMEDLAVDKRRGFFVNHDLASYEVPVHADIPHQQVIFLDETDPLSSPMKAKGVGELGLCGVAACVANAVYNATGVRVRDYPLTLDKLLPGLPAV